MKLEIVKQKAMVAKEEKIVKVKQAKVILQERQNWWATALQLKVKSIMTKQLKITAMKVNKLSFEVDKLRSEKTVFQETIRNKDMRIRELEAQILLLQN